MRAARHSIPHDSNMGRRAANTTSVVAETSDRQDEAIKKERRVIKVAEYKEKVISLDRNRKLINACKKAGLECFNPQGRWNGYGYEKLPMAVCIKSLGEMRKFNKIKKELDDAPAPKQLTEEEITKKWCKRLVKLTGIDIEDAREIAKEKLEYKDEQIDRLNDREALHPSRQRQKLINRISRSNPLRYIKDEEHAYAIIEASERHNLTNYEGLLEQARDMAAMGEIDRDEVKEYARQHMRRYNQRHDE